MSRSNQGLPRLLISVNVFYVEVVFELFCANGITVRHPNLLQSSSYEHLIKNIITVNEEANFAFGCLLDAYFRLGFLSTVVK